MVATVTVREAVSDGPTYYTITSARFCTTDMYNPESTYPCVVPDAGFNYSYWKHFQLYFEDTFTNIDNIRIYSDGTIDWSLGTGGGVFIGVQDTGDSGCPSAEYEQSAGTEGTTGYSIMDETYGHDHYSDQDPGVVDVTSYTSGSTLTLDSTDYTSAGDASYFAVMQVKIADDATQGTKAAETITFLYDEI